MGYESGKYWIDNIEKKFTFVPTPLFFISLSFRINNPIIFFFGQYLKWVTKTSHFSCKRKKKKMLGKNKGFSDKQGNKTHLIYERNLSREDGLRESSGKFETNNTIVWFIQDDNKRDYVNKNTRLLSHFTVLPSLRIEVEKTLIWRAGRTEN